jgi:hypothetical protein
MRFPVDIRQPLALLREGFHSATYLSANGLVVRVPKNAVAMAMQRHLHLVLEVLAPRIGVLSIPSPFQAIPSSDKIPFGATTPTRRHHGAEPRAHRAPDRGFPCRVTRGRSRHLRCCGAAVLPRNTRGEVATWRRCEPFLRDMLPSTQFTPIARWYDISIARLSTEPPTTRLIHGDFWHENLIFDGAALAGVIDFESVGTGAPVTDLMTLGYAGNQLRAATVREYRALRPDFASDARLAHRLLGLRELAGLAYGLETGDVDADSVAKIVAAARPHGS